MFDTRLSILTALPFLSACNGDNPGTGPVDADGDGVLSSVDCNDHDETIKLPTLWHQDSDGDGFGSTSSPQAACTQPDGYVDNDDDCNDASPAAHPYGTEVCDGVDNDCNDLTDDESSEDISTWYADLDDDGYGNENDSLLSCDVPENYTAVAGDCDDNEPLANPWLEEVCRDGIDNDCDGTAGDCGYAGEISLSGAYAVLRGEDADDQAGTSVADAGDGDGDGLADLVIGAPGHDLTGNSAGAVYITYGPLSGETSLASSSGKLTGEYAGDNAGSSVAGVGDLNGDGFGDLMIGADFASSGEGTDDYVGAAYLYDGPVSGSTSLSASRALFFGENSSDYLGSAVGLAGDTNGDGTAEVFIGANGAATGAGAVYLINSLVSGTVDLSTHIKLTGEASADSAGLGVVALGDGDGDGIDDLAVGSHRHDERRGAVYIVRGPITASLSLDSASAKLSGEAVGDYAGRSLDNAGDMDGDGLPDLIIGADFEDSGGNGAGAAYLTTAYFSGEASLVASFAKLTGADEDDHAGASVSGVADVDQDGNRDFLIGANGHDGGGDNAGGAYLVYGPVSGAVDLSSADALFLGEADDDEAGEIVGTAGDMDGDGYPDFFVGAPAAASGAEQGIVYLLLGNGW